MAPGEQAATTSCPVTLAATMDLGAWEHDEPSKDEIKIQRDASPYPQLPVGYDQTRFSIEQPAESIHDPHDPQDAPLDTCARSHATAEQTRGLLSAAMLIMVQVMHRRTA